MVFETFDIVYPCHGCFYRTGLLIFINKPVVKKKLVFIEAQEYLSAS